MYFSCDSGEAERKSLVAQEKEQAANGALTELQKKLVQNEKQIVALTKEIQKLENTVSSAVRDSQTAAASQAKCAEELEQEKFLQATMIEDLQKEKELISTQSEYEKTRLIRSFDQKLAELESKLTEKVIEIFGFGKFYEFIGKNF